jgi:hypothetical protein
MPRLYTEDEPLDMPPPPPPILVRHDTSIGGWVAERTERRVTFQEFPEPLEQMLRQLHVVADRA